jgi:hypothetical protein
MYWLNKLELPTLENSNCPKTTMWDRSKIKKEVYMLTEKKASIVNWYEETTNVNVWEEHFKKK